MFWQQVLRAQKQKQVPPLRKCFAKRSICSGRDDKPDGRDDKPGRDDKLGRDDKPDGRDDKPGRDDKWG